MQTFLEGMPGSGKTYNAIKEYILPYLAKGGRVVTNIKGIDHVYIASLLGKTLEEVQALLMHIAWQDTFRIPELCGNDALVVIDELQDFWPQKQKMSAEHTEFVTQHRQRGLELVTMGQVLNDCNVIWKRRVQRKIVYLNQDGIGRPTKFLSTTFNGRLVDGTVEFEKVADGGGEYEEKYWRCYQSHVVGVENTERPKNDSFNVLKTSFFRFWLPLSFVGTVFLIYYLWAYFHNPQKMVHTPAPQVNKQTGSAALAARPVASPVAQIKKPLEESKKEEPKPPKDYIQQLLSSYKPRLSGFISMGDRSDGLIEFLDNAYRAQERIKLSDLQTFGWEYETKGNIVIISHGDERHFVTAWPVEPFGQSSQAVRTSPVITGRDS